MSINKKPLIKIAHSKECESNTPTTLRSTEKEQMKATSSHNLGPNHKLLSLEDEIQKIELIESFKNITKSRRSFNLRSIQDLPDKNLISLNKISNSSNCGNNGDGIGIIATATTTTTTTTTGTGGDYGIEILNNQMPMLSTSKNQHHLNEFITQNTDTFLTKLKDLTIEVKDLRSPYQQYYELDQLIPKFSKQHKLVQNFRFFCKAQTPQTAKHTMEMPFFGTRNKKKQNFQIRKVNHMRLLESPISLMDTPHSQKIFDPAKFTKKQNFIQDLEQRVLTTLTIMENKYKSSYSENSFHNVYNTNPQGSLRSIQTMTSQSPSHRELPTRTKLDLNTQLDYTTNNRRKLLSYIMKNRDGLSPNKLKNIQTVSEEDKLSFDIGNVKRHTNDEFTLEHIRNEQKRRKIELLSRKNNIYYQLLAMDNKSKGKIVEKLRQKVSDNCRYLQI